MSKKRSAPGTMLDLWRPPRGAGEPIGCLTTTYTFDPGLFDEQCLGRFLEVESDPNREDLAYLLERETRLGSTYAGVLVDHTQAGVEHSLRWDVLPVRIWGGKQHAKISLLSWTRCIRIIIASANLTESGYRYNHEIAVAVDSTPQEAEREQLGAAIGFLRSLVAFVPGAAPEMPVVKRSLAFLNQVEIQASQWKAAAAANGYDRKLVFSLPRLGSNPVNGGADIEPRSALDEAAEFCRKRGGSPQEAWIASPFFDPCSGELDPATAALCKKMARGVTRRLTMCVPAIGSPHDAVLRLAAPRSLLQTPAHYSGEVEIGVLPQSDADRNARPWHAKMLALRSDQYSALLIGSSNFTRAGLGIGERCNAEANLLMLAVQRPHAREPRELEAVWPEFNPVEHPEKAEWEGPAPEHDEEERADQPLLPAGFLVATYRGGTEREILLQLEPSGLPAQWSLSACGQEIVELLGSERWIANGSPSVIRLPWGLLHPPEKLHVCWPEGEGFWPLNVEDASQLPPPIALENMAADDMLQILAAADPSAAFRAWTKRQKTGDGFDEELDAALPTDLDPLARYDLRATFLRRVRTRARVLAKLRENLERPAFSKQAVQWRLEGFIGVKPLVQRLTHEVVTGNGKVDETLLTLADVLIVLRDLDYQPAEGALSAVDFGEIYLPFLRELAECVDHQVRPQHARISSDVRDFWSRVVERCQN